MAHQPLLGTGRSCHLTVLRDDSNFTADQLQQLTFNLAFTYAKATRSVSVPTPAYYASRRESRSAILKPFPLTSQSPSLHARPTSPQGRGRGHDDGHLVDV